MGSPDPLSTELEDHNDLFGDGSSISEEDRREILEEIDDVVQKNRISLTDDLFRISPEKGGVLLPVIINILAIVAVVAAFFFSARFFENRRETMNLEVESVVSTEGRLIEELKRESDARIAQKEEEINRIQQELSQIETRSRELQQDFASALERREAELRSEMEAELALERTRLQNLDISPVEMENRLREFEIQKQREIASKLEAFRAESQAELREKEEELQRSRQAAQQILVETSAEKEAIQQEAMEREARLTERFEEERAELLDASSAARTRLESIARLQETENLLTDQIIASYQSIMNRMEQGQYERALSEIEALNRLLEDPRIDDLPRISKRRGVERFVLDTLSSEIRGRTGDEQEDTAGLVDTAQRLFLARDLIDQAETAREQGDIGKAEELFREAVAALPAIASAVDQLNELSARRRAGTSRGHLSRGEALLAEGDISGALQAYRSAAEAASAYNKQDLEAALARFETLVTNTTEAELSAEHETELQELRGLYEGRIAEIEEESAAREEELLEQIAEVRAEMARRLAETEEELDRKLSASEDELTRRLIASERELTRELNSALETVEEQEQTIEQKEQEISELSSIIAQGRTTLEELRTRAAGLEEELAALRQEDRGSLSDEEIAELTREYTATIERQESRIRELSEQIATREEQLGTTEARLSRVQEQRSQLEEDLNAAVIELVDVVTRREGDDQYAALAKRYASYHRQLTSLTGTGSADDFQQAETLLSRFFAEPEIQRVFPDLGVITRRVVEFKTDRAEAAGREKALNENSN